MDTIYIFGLSRLVGQPGKAILFCAAANQYFGKLIGQYITVEMKLLVIGTDTNLLECQTKFGDQHRYTLVPDQQVGERLFSDQDTIFDFTIASFPQHIQVYLNHPNTTAFLNTTLTSLKALGSYVHHKLPGSVFGFCGLPTFLNRPVLEVSLGKESDIIKFTELCKKLNTEFVRVEDKVGLVTPRVICMVINEAYYTVEDGTATREDIDLAMKLGTNYPYGPFEWAKRIGIQNVYEVLNSVYEDTKDERYKICPLLKKEYYSTVTDLAKLRG